jgi:hypothetical protein
MEEEGMLLRPNELGKGQKEEDTAIVAMQTFGVCFKM